MDRRVLDRAMQVIEEEAGTAILAVMIAYENADGCTVCCDGATSQERLAAILAAEAYRGGKYDVDDALSLMREVLDKGLKGE